MGRPFHRTGEATVMTITQDQNPQPVDAAVVPRFAGFATFMRLPAVNSAAGLDIALIGIPWDGGTTNRAGARHGPREIRSQSSLMRRVVRPPSPSCRGAPRSPWDGA